MPEKPFHASRATHEFQRVVTVTGPAAPDELGLTDAHNHVWIVPPKGAAPGAPVLEDFQRSLQELAFYRQAGGGALVDCQPGGCGRDGRVLARLARQSGVRIIGCTGFHLRKYYVPEAPLWSLSAQAACDLFAGELQHGMSETLGHQEEEAVRVGFIKAACEARLDDSPLALLEGAAQAARQTGVCVQVHTEKGQAAEEILDYFTHQGFSPYRLVLCHMDKRPDPGLHRELAAEGVLLEYDTFFRPQYDPEHNLWPLLDGMLNAGLAGSIALATDLADPVQWETNGGPGLAGLLNVVQLRLRGMGTRERAIHALLGGNIARRLAHVI